MQNINKHRLERIYRSMYSRRGCILSILILFEYGEVVLVTLLSPITSAMGTVKLQLGEPREVRNSMVLVSMLGGRLLTYPRWLLQIYLMFVPGRFEEEAKKVSGLMKGSVFRIICSRLISIKRLVPLMVDFLIKFTSDTLNQDVREGALRVSYTVNWVLGMLGSRLRRVHVPRVIRIVGKERGRDFDVNQSLSLHRRYLVFSARVVGAVITPPDVVSQVRVGMTLIVRGERTIFLKCISESKQDR